jgi:sugar (pentulose or hexulose) kinase
MAPDLVLTIDAGTGSSRACVYSIDHNCPLAVAARECPVEHPAADRAEWQPAAWWRAILEALSEAVTKARRPPDDYLGITVTSLRQGFILLGEKGDPLVPGVLNYDRRGADYIRLVKEKLSTEQVYHLTGHWHAPELTLPKLLWFKHEQPDAWRRARSLLFVHDWLLFRLTGKYATAPSMIAAGQMGDCVGRSWATKLLESLGIPSEILSAVFEGGQLLGGLLPEVAAEIGLGADLPVHIGGGDTQFGCLGAGGLVPGSVVIVGGSTTPIMMTKDRPLFDPLRYPWVSPHLVPGLWAVETIAGHTGMLYKWLRDTFGQAQVSKARAEGRGDYEVLNDLAAGAPLGAGGLLTVATSPRWAEDTWQRKAPYVLYNFGVSHTMGHVARSIMEGVCFGVRGNLDQLERVAGEPLKEVVYTGGSARVPFWAQMMADVLGRPLTVPQVPEPAAAAGAQLVHWGQGNRHTLPGPATVSYEPHRGRHAAYNPVYDTYINVFEKMQRHFATSAQ